METHTARRHIAVIDPCNMSAVGLAHFFTTVSFRQYQLHLFKDFDSFNTALTYIPFFSVIYSLSDAREERRNCLVYMRELAFKHGAIQRIILAGDEIEARLIGQLSPSRLHGIISKSSSLIALQKQLITLLSETEQVNNNAFTHWYGCHTRILSPTERTVLRYMSSGLSIPEIAEQLERNIKTIRAHKYNAMLKLGVNSDVGLLDAADILRNLPMVKPRFALWVAPFYS